MEHVPSIEIKGLYKAYGKSKKFALKNVNLSMDMRGIFTLIGRNGAGKTTLIRILATQLMPTKGNISIGGLDVIKDAKVIRDRIAVIPQESRLIPWMTPRQNIFTYLLWRGFDWKEASRKTNQSLRMLGLSDIADIMPHKLSGGTKRKALVAQAISPGAGIIFLDEPTTGLDPLARERLWKILEKLKKKAFIVLTTHYLEEAEALSDHLAILDRGRMIMSGTLDDIRGSIGYPYAVKILQKKVRLGKVKGKITRGLDGHTQVFATEREANKLAERLISKNIKFSINPTSLEDIFYGLVRRSYEE